MMLVKVWEEDEDTGCKRLLATFEGKLRVLRALMWLWRNRVV